jgi:hypothetical protein
VLEARAMSITNQHEEEADRPSAWAIGILAFSIAALAVAFVLLAIVP